MAAKTFLFHEEARDKILSGVNILANAVKVTLGPRGRTALVQRGIRRAGDRQLGCDL